ncbi:hypothetical protein JCM19047_2486 [Bacillus sp. JCM 19047]|nr:hypothetical protein JCM19047_2486 [Bacillus sp. JCM 19047]
MEAEETVTNEVVDDQKVDDVNTVEEPENKSETKTFTQEEVNALIADRLGREKKKYADYDDVKAKASEYDSNATTAQEYEELLTTLIEQQTEKLPESFRELVPSNLSKKDQYEWISKAVKASSAKTKKETPIGTSTNPKADSLQSFENLNPSQLLARGYGTKN